MLNATRFQIACEVVGRWHANRSRELCYKKGGGLWITTVQANNEVAPPKSVGGLLDGSHHFVSDHLDQR